MRNWELKKVGEVCKFEGGSQPPKSQFLYKKKEGYVRLIQIRDYKSDNNIVYIPKNKAKRFCDEDDIMIGRYGPPVFQILKGLKGAYNVALMKAIPNEEILLKDYAFMFLKYSKIQDYIVHLSQRAAGQTGVNKEAIQDYPILVPPLPEQQRIVAILNEAFAAIAKAIANAEQNLKNARELFESYLEGVFKNKDEGWEVRPFSELCHIKHGFAFEGKYFSDKGEYVLLTPGNFFESGGYRNRGDKQKYYTGEVPQDYVLKKGDLLVAMTEQAAGLLGSPILVPESNKFLHNQRLGLVIPKEGIPWTNDFFFHVFNTRAVREILHATGTGVKVRHTSPTKIGEVLVKYPISINVQADLVNTLANLNSESKQLEAIYQKKIEDLEELKRSILQKAFSGELKILEAVAYE